MYSPRSTEEEDFDTCLALGLGVGRAPGRAHGERRPPVQFDVLFSPEQSAVSKKGVKSGRRRRKADDEDGGGGSGGRRSPSDDGGKRKKLRLTKEQTALLEDSFHAHNILSHDQKHELARQLRLSARQVEVWFQNRRARTKLKQTEVDCEFLKRCSESLRDENRRLKQELMDLRRSAARAAVARSRFYVQPPRAAAMVNVCPSCDRVSVMSGGETGMGSSYCM